MLGACVVFYLYSLAGWVAQLPGNALAGCGSYDELREWFVLVIWHSASSHFQSPFYPAGLLTVEISMLRTYPRTNEPNGASRG